MNKYIAIISVPWAVDRGRRLLGFTGQLAWLSWQVPRPVRDPVSTKRKMDTFPLAYTHTDT